VRLHREGADVLFSFDSDSDFKEREPDDCRVDQAAWLPDRDYYFKDDASRLTCARNTSSTSRKCLCCWATMKQSASEAKVVMEIETPARSLDSTSRRDPQKLYHKISDKELAG